MMKPQIYQYISSIISSKALLRLISKTSGSASIILDLEDSVYDPNNPKRTAELKNIGRSNLYNLFIDKPNLKFGVRINSIRTIEFNHDIVLLNKLKTIEWDFIMLPKIESFDLLKRYIVALEKINYQEIVIIIESEQGFRNLPSILQQNTFDKIYKVHFGHYDYFLDSKVFPIPNQTDAEFWKVSEKFISIVEANGYMYIHSPINRLNDPDLIIAISRKLEKTCKHSFSLTSISHGQTKQMLSLNNFSCNELILNCSEFNNKTYAENLIFQFEKNQNRKFSFYRDIEKGIYIAPHEYLAAKSFLSNYGE